MDCNDLFLLVINTGRIFISVWSSPQPNTLAVRLTFNIFLLMLYYTSLIYFVSCKPKFMSFFLTLYWSTTVYEIRVKSSQAGKIHKMTSHLLWMTFWPMRFKLCNTDGRSLWTTGEIMLKNKLHLVTFHEIILIFSDDYRAFVLLHFAAELVWMVLRQYSDFLYLKPLCPFLWEGS